ncbi:cysteine hydrolase family protein [Aquibacillus albus]|uniref:Ureidoacrylate peracid hydrolase n=1 Tax=Aquibacillus albus TaxID=1168171 RepID=A0ABS2MWI0_9BACI|nr:isochorismatase family cysteine hydrolase [Aquibacillus albus]MBM7570222.1 ureidoacrylate peracid hydrolase [Aquibacillus albus]
MPNWTEIVDLKKSAVIVVDMQNDFCHPDGALSLNGGDVSKCEEIVFHTQKLIDYAHMANILVFFIKTTHDETTDSKVWLSRRKGKTHATCVTGTWGTEYFGVRPTNQDIEIIKHRYSAFIGTDLELKLRTLGCETLFITGVATNVCVESTLRDGYMLDFHVVLLSDCSAAASKAVHESTVDTVKRTFGWVADSEEVCLAFEKMEKENNLMVETPAK